MNETKWTPGPWRWQGEDYRGGWGWQMLVGPNGQGLIVGQDGDGGPCHELRGFMSVDPSLCITGLAAEGRPRVNSVHVLEPEAHLIAAAPDLYEALKAFVDAAGDFLDRGGEMRADAIALVMKADTALAKARGENPNV